MALDPTFEPTVLDGGITDSIENTFWALVGANVFDPARYVTYFNDFLAFVAADWDLSGGPVITQVTAGVAGGLINIATPAATTQTETELAADPFLLATGKECWFSARFALQDDPVNANFEIGLIVPTVATRGIYFDNPGDGFIRIRYGNASQSDVEIIGSIAQFEFVTVAFYFDGSDTLDVYLNDALVQRITGFNAFLETDLQITPSIRFQSADTTARNVVLDYLFAAQDR